MARRRRPVGRKAPKRQGGGSACEGESVRQLEAELKSRVSWNQTEEPRQIESNRRAASAGIKPESRVSWNRTGEPRQLESNRRAASAGFKSKSRVSWSQTGDPRQLESNGLISWDQHAAGQRTDTADSAATRPVWSARMQSPPPAGSTWCAITCRVRIECQPIKRRLGSLSSLGSRRDRGVLDLWDPGAYP